MKNNTLPLGQFSNKHNIVLKIIVIIGIILGSTFLCIWTFLLKQNFFLGIIIFAIIFFIIYILAIIKLDPTKKLIRKLDIEGDYIGYRKMIDNILSNNLHPETRNFVKILLVNALYAVDLDEAYNIFETIKRPTEKSYIPIYESVELLYYFNKEQYDIYHELLEKYKVESPNNIQVYKALERLDIVNNSKDVIENIESIYPYNTNNKFLNISSLHIMMKYYNIRDNHIKAKELAKIILDLKTDFNEINKDANEIINN